MSAPFSQEAIKVIAPSRGDRLLIVDRNVLQSDAIASAALAAGYGSAQVVNSAAQALHFMQGQSTTLVLADLALAEGR